ncbi:hypothetical protein HDU79_008538 [Rhizoclosmatium sp. JEL0117]|nr:hypothetical protein HDU79_008538 [Rhizoclosmatium sp. JEL0117]
MNPTNHHAPFLNLVLDSALIEPTTAESSPPSEAPNPGKSNRGRKRILADPKARRQDQNREAQQKFRERRRRHIEELEAKVAALESELNSTSNPTSTSTSTSATLCSACPACAAKDALIAQLQQENDRLKGVARSRSPALGDKTALTLYGQPETESCRVGLNAIPSIKNNPLIDTMLEMFLEQAADVDKNRIRTSQLKISATSQKLVNACNIVDRKRCLEVMAIFMEVNKRHMDHMYKISESASGALGALSPGFEFMLADLPPESISFRRQMEQISSLKDAHDVIAEFCAVFWLCNDETKFDRMTKLNRKILSLCANTDDMERYMLALEVAKMNSTNLMDAQLDQELRTLSQS